MVQTKHSSSTEQYNLTSEIMQIESCIRELSQSKRSRASKITAFQLLACAVPDRAGFLRSSPQYFAFSVFPLKHRHRAV